MRAVIRILQLINLRHVRDRPVRIMLAIVGVAAGVALTVASAEITSTVAASIHSTVRNLGSSADLEISAPGQSGIEESSVSKVEEIPGVAEAIPVLRATSRFEGLGQEARILVMGITPRFASIVPRQSTDLTRIRFSGGFGPDGRGVLLSARSMQALEVSVNDEVRIETPNGLVGTKVAGALTGVALETVNGGYVGAMLLPAAQELFERPGRVDSIYVVTESDEPTDAVRSRIVARIGGTGSVGPPGKRAEGMEQSVKALGRLTSLAGTIALLVGAFIVYNAMSMSVLERRRVIATSLALGAARREISLALVAEGVILGAIASIIGIGLGIGLAAALAKQSADAFRFLSVPQMNPLELHPTNLLRGLTMGLVVAVTGSVSPALRASRIPIAEGMKPGPAYTWTASGRRRHRYPWELLIGAVLLLLAILTVYAQASTQIEWLGQASLVLAFAGVTFVLPRLVSSVVLLMRPVLVRLFGARGTLSSDGLIKNPSRTAICVAAFSLTFGLVVGIGTALHSYREAMSRFLGHWYNTPLFVEANSFLGASSDQPLATKFGESLRSVRGVRYVYPWKFAFVNDDQGPTLIHAVPLVQAKREAGLNLSSPPADREALEGALAKGEVAISRLTATHRGLEPGEYISLPLPSGDMKRFRVALLFDDLISYDSVFMEYEQFAGLWNDNYADRFAIVIDHGADPKQISQRLEQTIATQGIPARVLSRKQLIDQILGIIDDLLSVGRGLQVAAVIVALITVTNTMLRAATERRWEFGLDQVLGVTRRELRGALRVEALTIGTLGSIAALLIGAVVAILTLKIEEAEFAWRVPLALPWWPLLLVLIASLATGLFAAGRAHRTASIPPIEALRYE